MTMTYTWEEQARCPAEADFEIRFWYSTASSLYCARHCPNPMIARADIHEHAGTERCQYIGKIDTNVVTTPGV